MDDFGKALSSLKGMLETEEGRNTLNTIMTSLTGGSPASSQASAQPSASVADNTPHQDAVPVSAAPDNVLNNFAGGSPLETIGRYGDLLSSIKSGSHAPRMQLLSALKPYLSTRRQQRFDLIMNLMKYSEVPLTLYGRNNKK